MASDLWRATIEAQVRSSADWRTVIHDAILPSPVSLEDGAEVGPADSSGTSDVAQGVAHEIIEDPTRIETPPAEATAASSSPTAGSDSDTSEAPEALLSSGGGFSPPLSQSYLLEFMAEPPAIGALESTLKSFDLPAAMERSGEVFLDTPWPFDGAALTALATTEPSDSDALRESFSVFGTKWGPSNALGTSGGIVTWSFMPSGITIDFGGPNSVALQSFIGFDFDNIVKSAFDAWAKVADIEFLALQDPNLGEGDPDAPDIRVTGENLADELELAHAYFPTFGDVHLNSNEAWNANALFLVMLHEIGHSIGLGHEEINQAVMNPFIDLSLTGLLADDINGARQIYGPDPNGGAPLASLTYSMPVGLDDIRLNDALPSARGTDKVNINGNILGNEIDGNGSRNVLKGFGGSDTLDGLAGNDRLLGGASADVLYGRSGNDVLQGNTGNDRVFGGSGNDSLVGGDGDDRLLGESGADVLVGEDGNDILVGSSGNDRLVGGLGADSLNGGSDKDRLFGGASNDDLSGGRGADELFGGSENDRLLGDGGRDELFGQDGADTLTGGGGSDLVDGGTGSDTASYSASAMRVDVNLIRGTGRFGDAEGDSLISIENLLGSPFDDRLTGNDSVNVITGGSGNDVLRGEDDNDSLAGGAGNDILRGGRGDDDHNGGRGDDFLSGSTGDDRLEGGRGNDTLIGGAQNDTLLGQRDNDTLLGQLGDDSLTGSRGVDLFVFADGEGLDIITDFTPGRDNISLADVTDIMDFDDLGMNHITDLGADLRIDTVDGFGGIHTITLIGVADITDLSAGDFIFV